MANQEIKGVTIHGIVMDKVPIEDMDPLELASAAHSVEDKMHEIEEKTQSVNTLKSALLAAMDFSCQNYLKNQEIDASKNKLDSLIIKLKQTLKNAK
ncbi:MAG TPA: cell division protein ZapA [Elusimicrobiales bacterium]|nr:cell division protein ZapA [Elusimicrobiales bacterium]